MLLTQPAILFLNVDPTSAVGPYMDPYPLWVDYALEHINSGNEAIPPPSFRDLHLHMALAVPVGLPDVPLHHFISTPHGVTFECKLRWKVPNKPLLGDERVA